MYARFGMRFDSIFLPSGCRRILKNFSSSRGGLRLIRSMGWRGRIADKMTAAGMEEVRLIEFRRMASRRMGVGDAGAYDVHRGAIDAVRRTGRRRSGELSLNPTSLMLYSLPTPRGDHSRTRGCG